LEVLKVLWTEDLEAVITAKVARMMSLVSVSIWV
jgi:hypothetical protein